MERGPGPQQLRVGKGRAESTSVRRGLSHHTALHFPWPPQEGGVNTAAGSIADAAGTTLGLGGRSGPLRRGGGGVPLAEEDPV